ncbi:DUF3283 family protein [Vibrio mediterranei]|uniref:DUF3283 family protein n=1 Tax=Vibrio mediterranei TaxID=689 RepID=UPI0040698D08
MSYNLGARSKQERDLIETEKAASFIVWEVRNGKKLPQDIDEKLSSIEDPSLRQHFIDCVRKYQNMPPAYKTAE